MYSLSTLSILAKTAKGLEEIDKRTYKLAGRLRAILFMIDGQKTLGELLDQAGEMGDQLEIQIAELVEKGFIAAMADDFSADEVGDESADLPVELTDALGITGQMAPLVPNTPIPPQPAPVALTLGESKKRIGVMLKETMGMRAMFLTAQLENIRTLDALSEFIDETERSVAVSNGNKVATQWRDRARVLAGL